MINERSVVNGIQPEDDEAARIEWMRAAARGGLDQLERGEGIEFDSMDEFAAFVDGIAEEVSATIAAERARG